MDIEISAEAKNRALNRKVAITVIAFSVFLGLTKIKDDNLVQAMQQAKADALDTWGEYQAAKTKLHIAENALAETDLLGRMAGPSAAAVARARTAGLQADIARYRREVPELSAKARGFEARYDALNVHDDQFDACDALVSIAVSAAAVAALAESGAVLVAAWAIGALGVVMGLAGILGRSLHPAILSRLLG